MAKKLSEAKKLKAYKAFEDSQVMQIPKEERQDSAIFQVRVLSMMDRENSRKGGHSFVASALKVYEFTPEELYRFLDGMDCFKAGAVEELQDFERRVKEKMEKDVAESDGV